MSFRDIIRLEETCGACPEQYDAYLGDEKVGYLRLRHGYFTVTCPWVGGKLVYEAQPRGDGLFEYEERDRYLEAACAAILGWIAQGRPE
jgi:hypothetical protein